MISKKTAPYLIGIAGPSCSGKTGIAEELGKQLKDYYPTVIALDLYYKDLSHLRLEERHHQNFDCPEIMDFDLLVNHLCRLKTDSPIELPIYDFATHTRSKLTKTVNPTRLIIIEGIFALFDPRILNILDLKVYVEIDFNTALDRRIKRDTTQRGRTEQSVREQFEKTVIPMAEEYIIKTSRIADLKLNGSEPTQQSGKRIVDYLSNVIKFE